jgi:hypothetical protein
MKLGQFPKQGLKLRLLIGVQTIESRKTTMKHGRRKAIS